MRPRPRPPNPSNHYPNFSLQLRISPLQGTAIVILLLLTRAVLGLPADLQDDRLAGGPRLSRSLDSWPLSAWDCSNPSNIEDRALDRNSDFCPEPGQTDVMDYRNVTVEVLKSEHVQVVDGVKCTILDTRTVRQCGAYDHDITLTTAGYHDLPIPPTAETCREMVENRSIRLHGKKFTLGEIGTVNRLQYFEVGHSGLDYEYNADDAAQQLSPQCRGGTWTYQGRELYYMVVHHEVKVSITKEEVYYNGRTDTLKALTTGAKLGCTFNDHQCETALATYIWRTPKAWCPLAVSRSTKGMLAKSNEGTRVFMSTDGQMLRFLLTEQVQSCNHTLWATNYPGIFLHETSRYGHARIARRIHPELLNLPDYSNNKDDFLYHHALDRINQEMKAVIKKICRSQRRERLEQQFLKHDHPRMVPYSLGNGTFAVASGEVLYYYKCEHLSVQALTDQTQCYDALPVAIPKKSMAYTIFNQTRWFIEPLTHQLTRVANVVPCTLHFAPKYKLASGKWIYAAPDLHLADSPKPTEFPTIAEADLQPDKKLDFVNGGLYEREAILRNNDFNIEGRTREAVISLLTQEITRNWTISPASPEFLDPSQWFRNPLDWVTDVFTSYGTFAAGIWGLLTTLRVVAWVFSWIYSGCQMKGYLSPAAAFWWAFCPGTHLLRENRERRRAAMVTSDSDSEDPEEEPPRASRPSRGRSPRRTRRSSLARGGRALRDLGRRASRSLSRSRSRLRRSLSRGSLHDMGQACSSALRSAQAMGRDALRASHESLSRAWQDPTVKGARKKIRSVSKSSLKRAQRATRQAYQKVTMALASDQGGPERESQDRTREVVDTPHGTPRRALARAAQNSATAARVTMESASHILERQRDNPDQRQALDQIREVSRQLHLAAEDSGRLLRMTEQRLQQGLTDEARGGEPRHLGHSGDDDKDYENLDLTKVPRVQAEP